MELFTSRWCCVVNGDVPRQEVERKGIETHVTTVVRQVPQGRDGE